VPAIALPIRDTASLDRRRLVQWALAFAGLSAAWHLAEGALAEFDLAVTDLAEVALRS
jgi:streptomycin 6-kinase